MFHCDPDRALEKSRSMRRPRRLQLVCLLALAVLAGGAGCLPLAAAEEASPAASGDLLEGQSLILKAEVEGGEAPFYYLWFKDYLPLTNSVEPELRFDFLRPSDAGTYWVTVFNDAGSTTSASEVITIRSSRPSRLTNVSVVGSARDRIIVGFTMGGNGTRGLASVLARAAGPALTQFGIAGALADPVLNVKTLPRIASIVVAPVAEKTSFEKWMVTVSPSISV